MTEIIRISQPEGSLNCNFSKVEEDIKSIQEDVRSIQETVDSICEDRIGKILRNCMDNLEHEIMTIKLDKPLRRLFRRKELRELEAMKRLIQIMYRSIY